MGIAGSKCSAIKSYSKRQVLVCLGAFQRILGMYKCVFTLAKWAEEWHAVLIIVICLRVFKSGKL